MVLVSILVLCILGVLFAVLLGIANKVFHVEEDPKIAMIESALSGANCGACGYPGCSAYATAIVAGEAIDKCAPGGQTAIEEISKIMGMKTGAKRVKNIAWLICQGDCDIAPRKSVYIGAKTCREAKAVGFGDKTCKQGCLGYGDCEAACPFDAIHIGEKMLPVIDREKCTGCGVCVKECPQNTLVLQPLSKNVLIRCINTEPAKNVIKECGIGCIGCGICEKNCPIDGAIIMGRNLAVMQYGTCVDCGICASVCPKKSITDEKKERYIPKITDKCTGCTLCARTCPVTVITGKIKEKHIIDPDRCIGCLKCVEVCRFEAIVPDHERPKSIPYYKERKFNVREKKEISR